MNDVTGMLLGKATPYPDVYDPGLLYPISRHTARARAGFTETDMDLPFHGADIWNGYELAWLNANGVPQVAVAEFTFPVDSTYLIESKSFKLYLNSFHQSSFASWEGLKDCLQKDLSDAAGAQVEINLLSLSDFAGVHFGAWPGECIDDDTLKIDCYQYEPSLLQAGEATVSEALTSHLLKSNCPVTGQPDFASVLIRYEGPKIERASLLRYIVSYRRHTDFHEHCVEQIFRDILSHCQPEKLTVYARYTRHGGLDINPFRSNFESAPENIRLWRQ